MIARFIEGGAVEGAYRQEEKSDEDREDREPDAQDIAGMTSVAEPGLENQGGGEQKKCRAANERTTQDDPISSGMIFRPHRASDGYDLSGYDSKDDAVVVLQFIVTVRDTVGDGFSIGLRYSIRSERVRPI